MRTSKISIIGGGRVGMSAAYVMLLRNTTRELVLYDRNIERMRAEQLEFQHSLTFVGATKITVAENEEDTKDSDIIIYTTGTAQEPGESRLDLAKKNTQILEEILPNIIAHSPNAVVIIVSNPVDILTYKAVKKLQLPKGRIFGTGTSLDSARFRFHLSEIVNINPKNIHTYILGEHGDSSFAALTNADIGGQPISTFPNLTKDQINETYLKTRDAAKTIIASKGSTYYAIGIVVNQLVDAVLRDSKRVFPVSVLLEGQYGFSDVALSVPCVLGSQGVEKILEISLSEEEEQKMENSVKVLKELL